ncbi:MAG TPA: hypothetical protein VHE35_34535 [Kofleriaceae bacterium]|nr:hypothetical protein [Kofleriaceae bacterium]
MRTSLASLLLLAALPGAVGCKGKKNQEKPAAGSGSGTAAAGAGTAAGTGGSAGTGAPTDTTQSATTTASGALKPVNECPPALKDTDKGLSRTIPAGCVTSVEGEYYVDGELIIEAGAVLRFKPDAALYVGYSDPSKLVIKGTPDKPVTFASGGDPVPGAWRGVHLYEKAARSQITGLVVEHANVALELDASDVSIKDTTLRASKDVSVRISNDVTLAAFDNVTFDQPGPMAMSLPPSAMIGLGAGNHLPPDTTVELRAGTAAASGTWPALGAPVRVDGEVYIEAKAARPTITLAAGATYKFDGAGALYAGYNEDGELKAAGTPDKPITFDSSTDAAPGAWDKGIVSYEHGTISLDHVVVKHGGADGAGAVRAQGGKLSITGSTIAENTVGVSLDDSSQLVAFDGNTLKDNKDQGMIVRPRHLGSFGAGNTWNGQQLLVHNGNVETSATWALQKDAAVVVDGELYVDGATVTIPAGARYLFSDSGGLFVGYNKDASLVAEGTATMRIVLQGQRDEVGAWKGLELDAHSVASKLAHVSVRDSANGCVRVNDGTATIDDLVGGKCETATLTWSCSAKVTQTNVTAEKPQKTAAQPPSC